MEKIRAGGWQLSLYFYQFIVLNGLFLVTNSLFFQIFFAVDFKPIFFPLYFVVSLSLLPSSIAIVRTIDRVVYQKKGQILQTYWQQLKRVMKVEKAICLVWTMCFYLTLTGLYAPLSVTGLGGQLLLVFNLIFLVAELGLFILITGHSIAYSSTEILRATISQIYPSLLKVGLLAMLAVALVTLQRLSFTMILFIFSGEFYLLVFLWQPRHPSPKHQKKGVSVDVSSQSRN